MEHALGIRHTICRTDRMHFMDILWRNIIHQPNPENPERKLYMR